MLEEDSDSLLSGQYYVHLNFGHWMPFIVGSIAYLFVNLGSHEGLVGGMAEDESYVNRVRIGTAIALCVLFACLLGGIIWAGCSLLGPNVVNKWPGASMIISLLLLTGSAILYRLKRFVEKSEQF